MSLSAQECLQRIMSRDVTSTAALTELSWCPGSQQCYTSTTTTTVTRALPSHCQDTALHSVLLSGVLIQKIECTGSTRQKRGGVMGGVGSLCAITCSLRPVKQSPVCYKNIQISVK